MGPYRHALPAVVVELGPLLRDATVKFYPAVFLANAMAAFILNLVRCLAHLRPSTGVGMRSRLPQHCRTGTVRSQQLDYAVWGQFRGCGNTKFPAVHVIHKAKKGLSH